MPTMYIPTDWYWIVAGDATHVWSSARAELVAVSDATYTTWLRPDRQPSRIASYAELYDVLAAQAPGAAAAAGPSMLGLGVLTPQQGFAVLTQSGAVVTSTGTPALNGTYAVDQVTQNKLSAIAAGIAAGKGLPGGGSTIGFMDKSGVPHAFTSDQFLDFASAIEAYVYALLTTEATLLAGGSAAWPSPALTIA